MRSRGVSGTSTVGLQSMRVYEVDTRPAKAGRLLSVSMNPVPLASRELIGRTCWEVFEHRNKPCGGCPVFTGGGESGVLWETVGAYRVVRFSRHPTSAEVEVCAIEPIVVSDLIQEKLRRLAERARLSGQQNHVLTLLSRGKSTKEIAAETGITERTAKFHVTNLLRKLGAGSRVDVLRLLLFPTTEQPPAPESPPAAIPRRHRPNARTHASAR